MLDNNRKKLIEIEKEVSRIEKLCYQEGYGLLCKIPKVVNPRLNQLINLKKRCLAEIRNS
jgi:hypothetical protein